MRLRFLALVFCLSCASGWAAFQDLDLDARSAGMGGASIDTIASLGLAEGFVLSFTHSSIFSDLVRGELLRASLPFGRFASLGFWLSLVRDSDGVYKEESYALGYAIRPASNFSLGVAVKMMRTRLNEGLETVRSNPYIVRSSSSAFTIDLGVSATPTENLMIGISLHNALPAKTSLSEEGEDIPTLARAFISYKLASLAPAVQQAAMRRVLSGTIGVAELSQRADQTTLKLGLESGIGGVGAIRFGYSYSGGAIQPGSSFSFGLGLRLSHLRVDYAYQVAVGDLVENSSHRISSSLEF